ncbi:MAG: HNH endonuclease signature motif containing protein [Candidatus Woesearchaeota archaeon]|nr:HNH endonuclease signature motif containing protein [Candidatus Woesearchaeota archaeon]
MPRNLFDFGTRPMNVWEPNSKSKKKCPSTTRNKIRKRWWGADKYKGKCFCCGESLSWSPAVHVGRIKAGASGGTYTPENSRLVCTECNLGMSKTNMKVYMKNIYPERYKKYFPKSESESTKKSKTRKSPRKPANPFGIQQSNKMPQFRF